MGMQSGVISPVGRCIWRKNWKMEFRNWSGDNGSIKIEILSSKPNFFHILVAQRFRNQSTAKAMTVHCVGASHHSICQALPVPRKIESEIVARERSVE